MEKLVERQRHAVFLDRDGTLVHPYHYPSRPEHLRIYESIGPALHRLQNQGFALVLVTNQSGIARGYFTEEDLSLMHAHLQYSLAACDVTLDGIYFCPHHPDGVIPELAIRCDCRKPRPGMILQAAHQLELDVATSWFVGDTLDDVEAGNRAGCHTILVDLGTEQVPKLAIRQPDFIARNTLHALRVIEVVSSLEGDVNLVYCPPTWLVGTSHA
jgi:D-glycero-D-manno-heptose 1,7-bisphosphate phosphatase